MSGLSSPADIHDALDEQLSIIQRAITLNKEMASQIVGMSRNVSEQGSMSQVESLQELPPADIEKRQVSFSPRLTAPLLLEAELEACERRKHSVTSISDELLRELKCERKVSISSTSDEVLRTWASEKLKESAKLRMDNMFRDTLGIEKTVSDSLQSVAYNVEDFYHSEGCYQEIARSDRFKRSAFALIALNLIYIGIETDFNDAIILSDAPMVFQVCDNLFCVFFFAEYFVRVMALRRKATMCHDIWYIVDGSLVFLMIWETWVLVIISKLLLGTSDDAMYSQTGASVFRFLRLIRVVRVFRASRLLLSFPELLIIARGLRVGLRSLAAVFLILTLLVYVFAIIFVMTLRNEPVGDGVFESVPTAMNQLMLTIICGPDASFLLSFLHYHWTYYVVIIVFIMLGLFTVMNMLIGILCDAVSKISEEAEEEHVAHEVEKEVEYLAERLDTDGDGTISRQEFDRIIKDARMTSKFKDLGVDIVGIFDYADFIFAQSDEMTYTSFEKLVNSFRGGKVATVKDVTDITRYITVELVGLESRVMQDLDQKLLKLRDHFQGILSEP